MSQADDHQRSRSIASFITQKINRSLRQHGLFGTFRIIFKNVIFFTKYYLDGRIDRQFGTDTRGRIELSDLVFESPNKDRGVYYEPTPERTFRKFMSILPASMADFSFVDFGSGKGRVLLYAGSHDFKRIIGVEFSPEFANAAQQNANLYAAKTGDRRIEVRCEDATETPLPEGPCVFYFYNPFKRDILQKVADRIRESYERRPRKIYIIYYNIGRDRNVFFDQRYLKIIATGTYRFDPAMPRLYPYAIFESLDT